MAASIVTILLPLLSVVPILLHVMTCSAFLPHPQLILNFPNRQATTLTNTVLRLAVKIKDDEVFDPSMAKKKRQLENQEENEEDTTTTTSSKKKQKKLQQSSYVPSGLTLEEYTKIKTKERERLEKMEFGIWGPKFDRMDGPLIDGMTWMFTPKLWTGEVESPPKYDGGDEDDELERLGDSDDSLRRIPTGAWEYATEYVIEINEYGDTIEHVHEWYDTYDTFYNKRWTIENIAINNVDFNKVVGVEDGKNEIQIEKMNVVKDILQALVHGFIPSSNFPFHILASETKTGTPTVEDWNIMKETELQLGLNVTSGPDILKLNSKTSDEDLICGSTISKLQFLQAIYETSQRKQQGEGGSNDDSVSDLNATAPLNTTIQMNEEEFTRQDLAEMKLCMEWYIALRRLGINDPFGREDESGSTQLATTGSASTNEKSERKDTYTTTASSTKKNVLVVEEEPEPESIVLDDTEIMFDIGRDFLSNAVMPWKHAPTGFISQTAAVDNDDDEDDTESDDDDNDTSNPIKFEWEDRYEAFRNINENARGISMKYVNFNTVDINEGKILMALETCTTIRLLLQALFLHGKILETDNTTTVDNEESLEQLERLCDPNGSMDCIPPNKAEWLLMKHVEKELNLDVTSAADDDVPTETEATNTLTTRIGGKVPKLDFLRKLQERIKGGKSFDELSQIEQAKLELKLDWYLTLRRVNINDPYPSTQTNS